MGPQSPPADAVCPMVCITAFSNIWSKNPTAAECSPGSIAFPLLTLPLDTPVPVPAKPGYWSTKEITLTRKPGDILGIWTTPLKRAEGMTLIPYRNVTGDVVPNRFEALEHNKTMIAITSADMSKGYWEASVRDVWLEGGGIFRPLGYKRNVMVEIEMLSGREAFHKQGIPIEYMYKSVPMDAAFGCWNVFEQQLSVEADGADGVREDAQLAVDLLDADGIREDAQLAVDLLDADGPTSLRAVSDPFLEPHLEQFDVAGRLVGESGLGVLDGFEDRLTDDLWCFHQPGSLGDPGVAEFGVLDDCYDGVAGVAGGRLKLSEKTLLIGGRIQLDVLKSAV